MWIFDESQKSFPNECFVEHQLALSIQVKQKLQKFPYIWIS